MKKIICRCPHCGNVVEFMSEKHAEISCCGSPMLVLKANTSDGAAEKHVPAVSLDGKSVTVTVGEVPHPMTTEHHIAWIMVVQGAKTQYKLLSPDGEPKACFKICPNCGDIEVYEYCNLHGLWKTEIKL